MGFTGGLHYWWPKMFGRMYNDAWSKVAAIIIFAGFNLTFFPQFLLGYMGMPRRYHVYPPEFQVLNVLSSAGASILGVGYVLAFIVLLVSLWTGKKAGDNPWGATTLEWQTSSPPISENFEVTPVVTQEAYTYTSEERLYTLSSTTSPVVEVDQTPAARHHFESLEQQKDASTIGMWIFLVTEIMFFGGLFMAYFAYRQAYPAAFASASNKTNLLIGAFNTTVLICSSLTMALAVRCAAVGKKNLIVLFLVLTLILGSAFLGVKGYEYHDKWVHHEIPGEHFECEGCTDAGHASLFFSLYFGMTGTARHPHDHRGGVPDIPDY